MSSYKSTPCGIGRASGAAIATRGTAASAAAAAGTAAAGTVAAAAGGVSADDSGWIDGNGVEPKGETTQRPSSGPRCVPEGESSDTSLGGGIRASSSLLQT